MAGKEQRNRSRAARNARRRRENVDVLQQWVTHIRTFRHLRVAVLGACALLAVLSFGFVVAGATTSGATSPAGPAASDPGWVKVVGTSPSDVRQAVRSTRLFQSVVHAPQTSQGKALHDGTLGDPILERVYHPTPGMTDVWVVPVYQSGISGKHVTMLIDCAYDAANHRLRPLSIVGPLGPGDPGYGQPFPRFSAAQAISLLAQKRGIASIGAQAELVYFPLDTARLTDTAHPLKWTGGGQFPDLAVWRVVPPGGGEYIVGLDGNVYTPDQIPLAPTGR